MGFELDIFNVAEAGGSTLLTTGEPNADFLEWLVDEHSADIQKHFTKLWEYYSNPTYELNDISSYDKKASESGRCYVQAQEYGLPARITGLAHCGDAGVFGGRAVKDVQRKEVVVENDIAWRINAAVDFLFGKPISFVSRSPDSQKRSEIEAILKAVFAANGGIGFFQDMAVLGGVYGFVDCLVRPGTNIFERTSSSFSSSPSKKTSFEDVLQFARAIGLDAIFKLNVTQLVH